MTQLKYGASRTTGRSQFFPSTIRVLPGPKGTQYKWLTVAPTTHQSTGCHPGYLSITNTCHRVHAAILASLSSSHPSPSPKFPQLMDFPSPSFSFLCHPIISAMHPCRSLESLDPLYLGPLSCLPNPPLLFLLFGYPLSSHGLVQSC